MQYALLVIIGLAILIVLSFPVYSYFNNKQEDKNELRGLDEDRR